MSPTIGSSPLSQMSQRTRRSPPLLCVQSAKFSKSYDRASQVYCLDVADDAAVTVLGSAVSTGAKNTVPAALTLKKVH